jgi:hypothetical protein
MEEATDLQDIVLVRNVQGRLRAIRVDHGPCGEIEREFCDA